MKHFELCDDRGRIIPHEPTFENLPAANVRARALLRNIIVVRVIDGVREDMSYSGPEGWSPRKRART